MQNTNTKLWNWILALGIYYINVQDKYVMKEQDRGDTE